MKKEKQKKKEYIDDFAEVSERNYVPPVEDDATEKVLKVVGAGAGLGASAGLSISQLSMNQNSLFGYFLHDGGLVILGYMGAGLVAGALAGWLYTLIPGKK